MVYSNKFVMSIIIDGHVQKELSNGVIKVPFNSNYILRFRNKHNRRALVKFTIDGENVSGNGYVISANDSVDIHRHHDKDHAFKFVSLDSEEAHDFGKNGPNEDKTKGTIEAHFYLEKQPPIPNYYYNYYNYQQPQYTWGTTWTNVDAWPALQHPFTWPSQINCSMTNLAANASPPAGEGMNCISIPPMASPCIEQPLLRDGCTVEGSQTGQNFYTTYIDIEETYTVLKVFLQGFDQKESQKPRKMWVKSKGLPLELRDLEAENEKLRQKIAELENEKLKQKLKELES